MLHDRNSGQASNSGQQYLASCYLLCFFNACTNGRLADAKCCTVLCHVQEVGFKEAFWPLYGMDEAEPTTLTSIALRASFALLAVGISWLLYANAPEKGMHAYPDAHSLCAVHASGSQNMQFVVEIYCTGLRCNLQTIAVHVHKVDMGLCCFCTSVSECIHQGCIQVECVYASEINFMQIL